MSQRTCAFTGCDRKHRARGWCSTHYNQFVSGEAQRHPKTSTACVVCGRLVLRRLDASARYQPTCSVSCRHVVQWGARLAPSLGYAWRDAAVTRARRAGATIVDRFDREEIFERDGWTCQLCGSLCSSPSPFNCLAATVDHVVALSDGGEHSRANAQTLCLSCNSAKRAGASLAA